MVLEKEPDWERRGSHLYTPAERPDRFIREQVRPLFYRHTETGSEQREFKEIASERDFWRQSNNLVLSAVRITDVKISDWFPRAPGVYWSRSALRARDSVYSQPSFNDEILGEYVAPNSKESLVEKGGIGTVRLRPRRIDDEDCWLATALNGTQCHAGIPVALPVSLMARVGIPWGGRVTIEGRVRFLQDAGLDATASSVHHARPLIVFVDALEAAYTKPSNNHVIITPVALFESLGNRLRGRFEETMYAFVQCMAGSDSELDDASEWIEKYSEKHEGRIITNFDEQCPNLADAPLSYQRLVAKTYERVVIERYAGPIVAQCVEVLEQNTTVTQYFEEV